MSRFQGRTAIITGGAQGIGRAIADRLAAEGAAVVIADVKADLAGEAAVAIEARGSQALAVATDVTDAEQVAALVQKTLDRFGRIDILVNNAGTTRDGLFLMMPEADWDLVMMVNLKSAYLVTKAVVRSMMKQRYGRIVSISSVAGLCGNAGQANYAASKAGLVGFTKALAKELGPRGITVNAVAPGFVRTELTRELPEALIAKAVELTPLGRLGTVDDIAAAVAFLASEDAAFVTGQVLRVDGGMIF